MRGGVPSRLTFNASVEDARGQADLWVLPLVGDRKPMPFLQTPVAEQQGFSTTATNRYDVSADGQRFLINASVENAMSTPITVVVNWLVGVKSESR